MANNNQKKNDEKSGFLPGRRDYKKLLTYRKSVIIYDCTYIFCERFFDRYDRTVGQMVQAARSGKQNIVEGTKAAVTSTEMELKLTNVARASLEELLEDYLDFLRVRNLGLWDKDSKEATYVRSLGRGVVRDINTNTNTTVGPPINEPVVKNPAPEPTLDSDGSSSSDDAQEESLRSAFTGFMQSRPPEVCANIMICLVNQCNFLLDRQINYLEQSFIRQGGLRENMYRIRKKHMNSSGHHKKV